MMVDPDMGWRYGFPKRLPDELKGKDITEWLIQEGYPIIEIEKWNQALGYIPCRFWEEEVKEKVKTKTDKND